MGKQIIEFFSMSHSPITLIVTELNSVAKFQCDHHQLLH